MNGIYINDDFGNLFMDFALTPEETCLETAMTEEGLKAQIDYYAVHGVKAVLFNLNAMRAMFDSRTFDPIWKGIEERDGRYFYHGKEACMEMGHDTMSMALRLRELYRRVPDPQRIRYEYCHQKGIQMYISMRMNDVHFVSNPDNIQHGDFWFNRCDLHRADFKKDHSFWFARCFDYAKKEVYDYHLALVKEYFERFDMDGFELDWMRSPFYFRPGGEDAGRPVLTSFMRDVHKIVKQAEMRRGHKIETVVRCQAWPQECLDSGMDVFAWAEEGLFDTLVPSPYFSSNESRMPVELWKRFLPSGIRLAPCIDCQNSSGFAAMPADCGIDTGLAADYYAKGADTIYLFNHMYRFAVGQNDQYRIDQRKNYSVLADKEATYAAERRHAALMHNTVVEGGCHMYPFDSELQPGGGRIIRLEMGKGTVGRSAQILLGFAEPQKPAGLEVWLNGELCTFTAGLTEYRLPKEIRQTAIYSIPAGVLHDGGNQIDLIHKGTEKLLLNWAEIDLK